jgi:hypothetical protein
MELALLARTPADSPKAANARSARGEEPRRTEFDSQGQHAVVLPVSMGARCVVSFFSCRLRSPRRQSRGVAGGRGSTCACCWEAPALEPRVHVRRFLTRLNDQIAAAVAGVGEPPCSRTNQPDAGPCSSA